MDRNIDWTDKPNLMTSRGKSQSKVPGKLKQKRKTIEMVQRQLSIEKKCMLLFSFNIGIKFLIFSLNREQLKKKC